MAASDSVSQLESGVGDVRKVVRHWDEPMGSQMAQPVQPRSRHELSAPAVDLVTGKCKPGKMIRTVLFLFFTVDMTVSCKPEPDFVQQGANADVLPPTDSGMSAADVNTSTPVVTAPGLGGSDGRHTSKKSPSGDLSESSELLPSFGWSSSSSSSSSLTLPWGTAENSSPSFSPNRVKEGQSQISPSADSLINVSPLSPIEPNRENGIPQTNGVLLPTILGAGVGVPTIATCIRMAAEGHSYDGPDHSDCFAPPPPKRDMPPAGTTWVVPPGVAEKARMTDSGIPGCSYRFLESDELPFIDGNPVYGLQLHHPRFLELVGAPESPLPSIYPRYAHSRDHMGCAPGCGRKSQDDRFRNTGLFVQIFGI